MDRRYLPSRNDVLLAGGVAALLALELTGNQAIEPKWAATPIELVVTISLAWRRRFPLAVTTIAAAGMALESIAGVPIQEPIIPLAVMLLAVYSLVVTAPATRVMAGLAIVGLGLAVTVTSQQKGLGNFAFGAAWVAGAVVVGRLVRSRSDDAREHASRAERLEREREEHVRQAAEDERKRIARELHDVIAHSLSVMVVQAGAAEEMLRLDPQRAHAPVLSIQQTGREALAEMGLLLGVLHEHGADGALAPLPGLNELDSLAAETRAAGVPVELLVEGERRPLPPGIELSAYRIVQEALTNARKHAAHAQARVTVRYRDDELELEIVDDGTAVPNGPGAGLGLIGMRERVTVFGGSLESGPLPGGGFSVRASLPLGAEA